MTATPTEHERDQKQDAKAKETNAESDNSDSYSSYTESGESAGHGTPPT
jgi:hypothetical protein